MKFIVLKYPHLHSTGFILQDAWIQNIFFFDQSATGQPELTKLFLSLLLSSVKFFPGMWYISEFLLGLTLHKTDNAVHAAILPHGSQWLEQIQADISVPHWMAYIRCHLCIIKTSVMVEALWCAGFCWSKWSKMNFSVKPIENMLSLSILLLILSYCSLLWQNFKCFPYYVMQYLKPSSSNAGNIFFKESLPLDISSCCTSVLCKRLQHFNRKDLPRIFGKCSLTYLFLSRSTIIAGFPYFHWICILLCSCSRPQQVKCREQKPHTMTNAFEWKFLAQLKAAGIV